MCCGELKRHATRQSRPSFEPVSSRFDESPAGAPALGARFIHNWRISAGIVVRF